MKITTLALLAVLLTYEVSAQFTVSYLQGQSAFAEVSYEIGDRWEPALRIYPFGLIENLGVGLGVTYDVYEQKAAEAFVGVGLGYAAVSAEAIEVLVPVGMTFQPLADKRFGIRAEVDFLLVDLEESNLAALGSLGVRWRFTDKE